MKTLSSTLAILLFAQVGMAVPYINPERCAHDSLNQWSENMPLEGTARGRNQWLKVCKEEAYENIFPGADEFDPNLPDRRAYPTYGIITGRTATHQPVFMNDSYRAPTTPPANAADPTCVVPKPNVFVGLCTSGCVAPESKIQTPKGAFTIQEMDDYQTDSVLVPKARSNKQIELTQFPVKAYLKDMIEAEQKTLVITTESGGTLQVSLNHPLLTGENTMKKAEDLKIGDALVTFAGKKDRIKSLAPQKFYGKLHNLTVATDKIEESLYVVQGYISGDKKYQDLEVSEFNRGVLRQIAFSNLN